MKTDTYTITYESEDHFWWYVARREIVISQVRGMLKRLHAGGITHPRILDYGCGTGANLVAMSALADSYGVDMSRDALEFSRGRGLAQVAQIRIDDLRNPFEHTFDVVTMLDVLEHIHDDSESLASLAGWLNPGGYILATVPAFNFLWSGEDYVSEHVRRYTARTLRQSFERAGYEVDRISYFNMFLFPLQAVVVGFNRLFRPQTMKETLVKPVSPAINATLHTIFRAEAPLLSAVNLPVGSSILCWARRKH